MKFAKRVFIGAGIWGIVVLTPIYGLIDVSGRRYAPPTQHPEFFYGFLAVAMAWQLAFLVIGSDPIRFRPFMILAVIEKLGYVGTLAAMYASARITATDAQAALPDFVLGLLFIVSFVKTRAVESSRAAPAVHA